MQVRALAAAIAVAAVGAGAANAATMHPVLGARLSGMGEHGVVSFKASTGRLCWTFDLETMHVTGASIRDAHGMTVVRLGPSYARKSCVAVRAAVLASIDRKPSSFRVWVDTKGHAGELRGALFAGMAGM